MLQFALEGNSLRYLHSPWAPLVFVQNDRLNRIMQEVEKRGRRAGFKVPPLTVVGIRPWLLTPSLQAEILDDDDLVFIWLRGKGGVLTDEDIAIILAHEYGHHVEDHLTRRQLKGRHPFLKRITCLDGEDFADAVAGHLYSVGQNRLTSRRHGLRFNQKLGLQMESVSWHRIRRYRVQ